MDLHLDQPGSQSTEADIHQMMFLARMDHYKHNLTLSKAIICLTACMLFQRKHKKSNSSQQSPVLTVHLGTFVFCYAMLCFFPRGSSGVGNIVRLSASPPHCQASAGRSQLLREPDSVYLRDWNPALAVMNEVWFGSTVSPLIGWDVRGCLEATVSAVRNM